MKLALLSKWTAIHTVRWVNELARRGHEVHLITMHPGGEALEPSVHVHRLPIPPPLGYYLNVLFLKRVLAEVQPDILNVHYASGYGTLGRLSAYHPCVLSVWGSDVYDYPYESHANMARVVKNLQAADWICSTSQAMAEQTRRLCPELGEITLTPFGIDLKKFFPAPENRTVDCVTIGTVKVLAPKYGIDTLIEAFGELLNRMASEPADQPARLKLRIVGGGPQQKDLEALAQSLDIMAAAEFVGRVPHGEVPGQLNLLDIYVAASRLDSESFGVAVLEASACGLPVVVTNVGGLPEVVQNGVTGFVVDKENPTALADALALLVKDSSLRRRMGEAGRRSVIESYDWDDNAGLLEDVFEKVIANGPVKIAVSPPPMS